MRRNGVNGERGLRSAVLGVTMWTCTVALAVAQTAAPPPLIPFQGYVTTATGAPLTARFTGIFSLYTQPQGGDPLWEGLHLVEPDAGGWYTVVLGTATALPVELFSRALWIGLRVDGEAERPRVPFTSVPYALKAGDADTLSGYAISAFVLVNQGTPSLRDRDEGPPPEALIGMAGARSADGLAAGFTTSGIKDGLEEICDVGTSLKRLELAEICDAGTVLKRPVRPFTQPTDGDDI